MRKGLFTDPALSDDRFDFSAEPLTDEEVEEEKEAAEKKESTTRVGQTIKSPAS